MEFRILGPVEVVVDGRPQPVGGTRQRALLAALLLHADEVVSTGRLSEALWGPEAPPTAAKTLQVHISRLRRDLGDDVSLVTRPPGYMLELDGHDLDLRRFDELAQQGRAALDAGDAEQAATLLTQALDVWRGPALADVADEPVAQTAGPRLEDQRLAVLEDRIDADLARGRATEVVPEISRLVEDHPLQERLRAQLMVALYRCGRQADALTAFQDARRVLAEELGIEPGPRLRDLESRILEQDPGLLLEQPVRTPATVTPARVTPPQPRRRQPLVVALAIVVLGVIAAGAIAAAVGRDREGTPPAKTEAAAAPFRAQSNTLVAIDADAGGVSQVAKVGDEPDQLVVTRDVAWVANVSDRTVTRVDTATGETDTIKGLPGVASIATTPLGGIFVSSFEHYVSEISDQTLQAERLVTLKGHAEGLAVGAGSLWITSPSDERAAGGDQVVRVYGDDEERRERFPVGATPIFAAFGYGQLWTSNYDGDTLSVIPPDGGKTHTVPVGDGPLGIAAGEGAIWVVQFGDQEVWRIDPVTREVVARIPVGPGPLGVAAGGGWVWVTCREDGTVVQIDPKTNTVHRTINVGLSPHGVAVGGGDAFVTVRAAPYGP